MRPVLSALLVFFAVALAARSSPAQIATSCDSCAACTQSLATPHVDVALSANLEARGPGPCIVVRGHHARFNGAGFTLRGSPGAVGIRVEAESVWLRNVTVRGGDVGVEVHSARGVTLFRPNLAVDGTGLRVARSPDLRVVRATIAGGRVGIGFGADIDGGCSPGPMRSPGAVIETSRIEGAGVGVAACDAMPVLRRDEILHGRVGLRLGDVHPVGGPGGDGPFDRCVCNPGLSGVRAGTTLMFSSGCGGCMVHEAWLPRLRSQGAEVRMRETGPTHVEAQHRFDQHLVHCAPAVIDALGLPGCVPNYACPATGRVAKVRQGDRGLTEEVPLGNPAAVLDFARACAAAGRAAQADGRCIAQGITDTTVCGQREADVVVMAPSARWRGRNNACTRTQGDDRTLGCTRPCAEAAASETSSAEPVLLSLTAPETPPDTPPDTPPQPPESPDEGEGPSLRLQRSEGTLSARSTVWLMLLAFAGIAGGWLARRRGPPRRRGGGRGAYS